MDRPSNTPLDALIRMGTVSSVDKGKHTVQVNFPEGDGTVSYDLPVLVTRAGDYGLPQVGIGVVCLMLPGSMGFGFVLGAFYSDSVTPPLDDEGQRSTVSDDLRLGDPQASDYVALAPAVKTELDAIKTEMDAIKSDLDNHKSTFASHTHEYTAGLDPYAVEGMDSSQTMSSFDVTLDVHTPESVAATQVKAK